MEIVKLGDDVLRQVCEPVKEFDSAFKMLTDAMLETLEVAEGVGLAAPQIGVAQRFFVIDIQDGKQYVFANPEILETSMETGSYEEGCLSIPGVYHDVVRPLKVKVQARDARGKLFTIDADGFLARVIQHEYDHLNGKLYIDHLTEEEKAKMIEAYEKKNAPKKAKPRKR
ncbi:MAG: peptide deformylase, partial [Spirochaetales bacterium]|nr:peptide deformylase [Candidatus Physcosoma equi]